MMATAGASTVSMKRKRVVLITEDKLKIFNKMNVLLYSTSLLHSFM